MTNLGLRYGSLPDSKASTVTIVATGIDIAITVTTAAKSSEQIKIVLNVERQCDAIEITRNQGQYQLQASDLGLCDSSPITCKRPLTELDSEFLEPIRLGSKLSSAPILGKDIKPLWVLVSLSESSSHGVMNTV